MRDMEFQDRDPNVVARLKQRFPAMGTVERLLTETRMRLHEVLDGELTLDGRIHALRISSRKTGTTRTVSITPDLVEKLATFLADPPANQKAMLTRALWAFGPAYRRSLTQLRYRNAQKQDEEA